MRHDKLDRELSLILLMTENHNYTVQQLCDKLNISKRNLYYYLDFFKDYGFKVIKQGTYYKLDKESPFFTKLYKTLHFTEEEAIAIRSLLDKADHTNPLIPHLKRKLEQLYDLKILNDTVVSERTSQNISILYDAIKYKKMVILHNYSSPHSNTLSSRIVEPFMFMNNNREVRCYEPTSAQNKTFKTSRMEGVEILSDDWEHEQEHRQMFTDIFMFSSEEQLHVSLRLNLLAYNILIEEYPQAYKFTQREDNNHWLLDINVCNYKGIARFVIGLYENIEILGEDDFKQYIYQKIAIMNERIK